MTKHKYCLYCGILILRKKGINCNGNYISRLNKKFCSPKHFYLYRRGKSYTQLYGERKASRIIKKHIKNMTGKRLKQLSITYKKITPELAYILGAVRGDGHISHFIRLEVTDKDFAYAFRNSIEFWSGCSTPKVKSFIHPPYNSKFYRVCFYSKIASSFLKSFNINRLAKSPNIAKAAFIRGFCDAESNVDTHGRQISISNQDKPLLILCKQLLQDLSINSRNPFIHTKKGTKINMLGYTGVHKRPCYRLDIGGRQNLIQYNLSVGFCIKRKQIALVNLLNSYKRPLGDRKC